MMSSIVPLIFDAVELCPVTINEKPLSRAKEVWRALAYKKAARRVVRQHRNRQSYDHKWQLAELISKTTFTDWPRDSQKLDLYINEEGMRELLVRSQQTLAKRLAEYMGIKIIGNKNVCKEASTTYTIQKVFEGIPMKRQFSIRSYWIDFYFPEHKLAIECNEQLS